MGVLKNDVGRPSNKTIKIRFALKLLLLIIVVGGLFIGGYLLNVSTEEKETIKRADVNQIKAVSAGKDEFFGLETYDIYYNDKKIIESNKEILGIDNISSYKNFAIFNIKFNDNVGGKELVIIDGNGNIVGQYDGAEYKNKNLTGKIYRGEYEIKDDKIYIHSDDDGQDVSISCDRYESGDASAYVDVISLSNGKFTSPKLYKSISAKEVVKDYSKQCNVSTNLKEEKNNTFDQTKITTEIVISEYFPEADALEVYIYGKKLDLNNYITKVNRIDVIDDIAILELSLIDNSELIVVDMDANILFNATVDTKMVYCTSKSSECYGYKTNGNTISFYVEDLGQDKYNVCESKYNEEVLVEYETTYENKKMSKLEKVSSMFGKEYIKKHNIDCSIN